MENKTNRIRKCPTCGVVEVIEVTRMVTINNERVRCKCLECDECGFIFERIPQKN